MINISANNTNYSSLVAQASLNKSYSEPGKAVAGLASAGGTHSANEGAAAQASFKIQISDLAQDILNKAVLKINDGIQSAQTAKDVLNGINKLLLQIRELAVQAHAGSKSAARRDAMQGEVRAIQWEINRMLDSVTLNGQPIFKTGQLVLPVGYNDDETVTVSLRTARSLQTLGIADGFNIAGPQGATFVPTPAHYLDTFGPSSAVTANTVTVNAEHVADKLGIAAGSVMPDTAAVVDSNGDWYVKVNIKAADAIESRNIKSNGFIINLKPGENKDYYVTLDPERADTGKIAGTAVFTVNMKPFAPFVYQVPETDGRFVITDQLFKALTIGRLNPLPTANPLQQVELAMQKVEDLGNELDAVKSRMVSTAKKLAAAAATQNITL